MPRYLRADRSTIRTERISLVVTEATCTGIKTLAEINGVSVNDLLNDVTRQLVEKNADVISAFEVARQKAKTALDLNVVTVDEHEKIF